MSSDLVDLLDRQYAVVSEQRGEMLFLHVARYLEHLQRHALLGDLLGDLEREAFDALDRFSGHQQSLLPGLRRVMRDLVRLAPEAAHDRRLRQTQTNVPEYYGSAAHFHSRARNIAGEPQIPQFETGTATPTDADVMLDILERKISALQWPVLPREHGGFARAETNQRPDLIPLEEARATLAEGHSSIQRRLLNRLKVEAPWALLRLQTVAAETGVPFTWVSTRGRDRDWRVAVLRAGYGSSAVAALMSILGLIDAKRHAEAMNELEPRVLLDLRLLHEELRQRVGMGRSRLALVHRFRLRCELYDRDELVQLTTSSVTPEDALVQRLVRFLFDEGMNPITKPLVGHLEPDVLDPSNSQTFYVEAKQYWRSAAMTIKRGMWQLHDTVAQLCDSPYQVDEAFYVIFRRGGPRYVLPERIRAERWTVHPVLIDIGPDRGSRQRLQPIELSARDLAPRRKRG